MRCVILAAAAALLLGACAAQPESAPQESLANDGRAIAEAQCSSCHAVGEYGDSPSRGRADIPHRAVTLPRRGAGGRADQRHPRGAPDAGLPVQSPRRRRADRLPANDPGRTGGVGEMARPCFRFWPRLCENSRSAKTDRTLFDRTWPEREHFSAPPASLVHVADECCSLTERSTSFHTASAQSGRLR